MSNNYSPRNSGQNPETRQFQPANRGYDKPQSYGEQQQNQSFYDSQRQSQRSDGVDDNETSLIAGKFDTQKTITNLAVLSVLAAVISFAIVLVVDLAIASLGDYPSKGPGFAVVSAIFVLFATVIVGLIYIPIDGTGNESLLNITVLALTIAAAALYVIFAGLLDGDWQTLVALAAIVCGALFATAAPARVKSAQVVKSKKTVRR